MGDGVIHRPALLRGLRSARERRPQQGHVYVRPVVDAVLTVSYLSPDDFLMCHSIQQVQMATTQVGCAKPNVKIVR
jgi:hypothetical protein